MPRDWTLLTVREVASQMSVTVGTVRRWIRTGQLPATTGSQCGDMARWGYTLVSILDLNKFIEKRVRAIIKKHKQKVGK
jgi:hypothetical protein